jgi:hypothetical protein
MLAGAQEEVTVQALLAAVLASAQGILGTSRNRPMNPTSRQPCGCMTVPGQCPGARRGQELSPSSISHVSTVDSTQMILHRGGERARPRPGQQAGQRRQGVALHVISTGES